MLRARLARTLFLTDAFGRARDEHLRIVEDAAGIGDHEDLVVNAQLQAARALAKSGDPRTAVRELERIAAPRRGDDESVRYTRVYARGELVEQLLEIDPKRADREALAAWRELKDDTNPGISYRAGLTVASSWRELEPEVVLKRSTWIIDHFRDPETPEVKTLVTMALNTRTRVRAESGDSEGAAADAARAVELADDDVPDFIQATSERNELALRLRRGDYSNRDDIYGVVRQLTDAADEASKAGDREASARDYWRAYEMANPSPDPATRLVGLAALRNWTFDLLEDRQDARAAEIARISIGDGIDDGMVGTEILAQAWLHLGVAANRLADKSTANYAFSQVSAVVKNDTAPPLIDLATTAEWNHAVLLDDGNHPNEALHAYSQLIARVAPTAGITQQRRVAKALKNSAVILRDELNRPGEASAAWAEIISRYDGHPDAELARLTAEARPHAPKPKRRGLFGRRR